MTSHVAPWLFVWVLLDQAGVPIPVAPSLLAAGALAAHAGGGLLVPVLVTVAATLVADLIWYGVGRWRGPQALSLLGRLSRRSAARVENAERRFLAHQVGFLFSSRFLPGLNPIAAGMAAAAGIMLGRYILIATTSALAWTLAWTGAGYVLGNITGQVPTPLGFVTMLGLLAGAILAVRLVLKHRWRHAIVLVLLTVLAVVGCAVGPDYKRPAVMGAAGWRTPT
jgi:membrane protein DedA with SNARE-associated domain